MMRALLIAFLLICVRASADTPVYYGNPVVQKALAMTASDGTWSVTWANQFAAGSPIVNAIPVNPNTQPIVCNVISTTATGASGKCWILQTTTLTLAIITAGIVLNPTTNSAAGIAVQLIGGNPTQ